GGGKDGTSLPELRLQTSDGYELIAEVTVFYNRIDGKNYLSQSLKYKPEEVRALIRSAVSSPFADLAGCNTFDDLLRNKGEVNDFIANIFDGEGALSAFESGIGYALRNPMVNSLNADEETKRTRTALTRIDVLKDKTREIRDKAGVSADAAFRGAQVAMGLVEQEILTQQYEGIPPSVTVFAPGSGGIAVGTKGKP
ncbi:MAG: hypothetical protein KGJ33_03075, partial [Patescibacteria group bacterium]|nr:hypothetical protein [Patescibacteria group bacterium]